MRNQGIGLFVCLWLLIPRLNFPKGVYQNLRWQWWIWDVNGVPFTLCCWWVSIHSNRHSPSDVRSWKCQNRAPGSCPTASHGWKQRKVFSVLIVDSVGVLQSMKKTPTMVKLSDFQEAFNKWIEKMMAGYDEGRVVFDRYIDQSLKNKTWQKRANTSIEYEVHPQIKLTMSIEELLSASSTKKKLTCMICQGLLDCFSRDFYWTLSMILLSRE